MDNLSESYPVALAKQVLNLEQVRTGFEANLNPELTDMVHQRLTWALMRFSGQDPFARMGSEAYARLQSIINRDEATTIIQKPPMPPVSYGGGNPGGGNRALR